MVRAKSLVLTVAPLIMLLGLGSVALAGKPQSITQCDDPGMGFVNITRSGTYVLQNNILANGPICIDIDGVDRVNLRLNGYKIHGGTNDGAGIKLQDSSRISIVGPGTIQDNHFGIQDAGLSFGVTIRKLLIISNDSVGIHLGDAIGASSDFLIEHNIIMNNNNHGIRVGQTGDVRIIENEVIGNFGNGIILNPGDNRVVRGNNVSFNTSDNMVIIGSDFQIVNNIILFAGEFEIDIIVNSDTGVVANNICETFRTGTLVVECPPDKLPDFEIDHF